jgi:polar amino acid transport system substrate-binding protein
VKKLFRILGLSLILMTAVVGCGVSKGVTGVGTPSDTSVESTWQRVKKQGYVTIGFANEKPYAYMTPDGKLTGEAVEVARTVLTRLGIHEMKGEITEFGSLIPGLKAKRFDMITAGMFIKPERCKEVAFADPEYSIGEAIAVKKGNTVNIHSYQDIAVNPKVKVAVMTGAIEADYLQKSGVSAAQIVTVPDQPSAIAALQAGRADAVTMTGPSLHSVLDAVKDPSIEKVMDFQQPAFEGKSVRGYGATAFRNEDKDFRDAFNRELQKLKQSGELFKMIQPFGFTKQELPGNVTAEQVCANEQ